MANKVENNYKVNPEKVRLETDQGIEESEERKWGMPLKDVYKHGLAFYKGNFLEYFPSYLSHGSVRDLNVNFHIKILQTAKTVNRASIITILKYLRL